MKKFLLIALFVLLLLGCDSGLNKNVIRYESENFTLEYPNSYSLDEADDDVIISNEKGKIVINSVIDGPGGVTLGNMTEEEIEQLPKHGRMHNYDPPIGSALYFYSGDTQTELELQAIQESIVIK